MKMKALKGLIYVNYVPGVNVYKKGANVKTYPCF